MFCEEFCDNVTKNSKLLDCKISVNGTYWLYKLRIVKISVKQSLQLFITANLYCIFNTSHTQ